MLESFFLYLMLGGCVLTPLSLLLGLIFWTTGKTNKDKILGKKITLISLVIFVVSWGGCLINFNSLLLHGIH